MAQKSVFFRVDGRVQGVGFRAFARRAADQNFVTGYVRNTSRGDVEGEVHGDNAAVDSFLQLLRQGPPAARVRHVFEREIPIRDQGTFSIRP